jgi:hypothetical protein
MKRLFFALILLTCAASFSFGQGAEVMEKTNEVMGVINAQAPSLDEYTARLATEKAELEERIIVLKYHQGNKEVNEACRLVVKRVEEYYRSVDEKIKEYESVWFEQMRNIMDIYTRYGELKEASGGKNDLQEFVDSHNRYLEQIDNVKADLLGVYADMSFIQNKI